MQNKISYPARLVFKISSSEKSLQASSSLSAKNSLKDSAKLQISPELNSIENGFGNMGALMAEVEKKNKPQPVLMADAGTIESDTSHGRSFDSMLLELSRVE